MWFYDRHFETDDIIVLQFLQHVNSGMIQT